MYAYASDYSNKVISADEKIRELMIQRDKYRAALELIAISIRPDGTYNRDRRACELLAKETLQNR